MQKTILITAGPTVEPIDPIRYISNYSTGTMGFELAKAAKARKYNVILISGPTTLTAPRGIRFIPVKTALKMRKEVLRFFKSADYVVMTAAVADFRPTAAAKEKIKKVSLKELSLKLTKNPDILEELGRKKGNRILIGYSLETKDAVRNAKKKLKAKNLDVIIVNRAGKNAYPFGSGAKDIAIIDKTGEIKTLKNVSKAKIAQLVMDKIASYGDTLLSSG